VKSSVVFAFTYIHKHSRTHMVVVVSCTAWPQIVSFNWCKASHRSNHGNTRMPQSRPTLVLSRSSRRYSHFCLPQPLLIPLPARRLLRVNQRRRDPDRSSYHRWWLVAPAWVVVRWYARPRPLFQRFHAIKSGPIRAKYIARVPCYMLLLAG
jgi:hypothetical protein